MLASKCIVEYASTLMLMYIMATPADAAECKCPEEATNAPFNCTGNGMVVLDSDDCIKNWLQACAPLLCTELQVNQSCVCVSEERCSGDIEDQLNTSCNFSADAMGTVMTTAGANHETNNHNTTVVITVVVALTLLVVLVTVALILALYWNFRIKLIRERNRSARADIDTHNNISYTVKTDKEKGGPVYSEIGDQVAPPPPSINRMPLYHQEIDKDMVAIVSCDIGEPCYQQDCLEQEGALLDAMDPYQEPIDALKMK